MLVKPDDGRKERLEALKIGKTRKKALRDRAEYMRKYRARKK